MVRKVGFLLKAAAIVLLIQSRKAASPARHLWLPRSFSNSNLHYAPGE